MPATERELWTWPRLVNPAQPSGLGRRAAPQGSGAAPSRGVVARVVLAAHRAIDAERLSGVCQLGSMVRRLLKTSDGRKRRPPARVPRFAGMMSRLPKASVSNYD